MTAGPRLSRLSDATTTDPHTAGGKAARLADLQRRGLPVPDGLVVPTNHPVDRVDLVKGLAALAGDADARFAVRSSALLEDGHEASFAGQYLTVLNVAREAVPEAIERVRASAAANRASPYARDLDGAGPIAMAVLIQPMIRPTAAGVAFTADPATGDRETTVVSAVRGLADRMVSGEQDAETWEVRGGQARSRGATSTLDAASVLQVAGLAARVAAIAGVPQDIEWAHDGHRLWLLQARPITALPPAVNWTPPTSGYFSRSLRFGEWILEPVTPLFESWLLPAMERRLHELHRKYAGIVAPEPLHVVVNGWYFYSLNFLPVTLRSLVRSGPHILARLIRQPRRVAMVFPPTARFGARLFEQEWRNDLLPRYLADVEAAEALVDTAGRADLVTLVDRLALLAGEYFASIAVVAGYAYKAEIQFARFFSRHLARKVEGGHLPLLAGLAPPEPPPSHAVSSLDWWRPTLGELAGLRPPEQPANTRHAAVVARREAAENAARAALAGSRRRLLTFDTLLAEAQRTVLIREEQVALLTRPWPALRRAVARLGEALVADGLLSSADDVFFLSHTELVAALDGRAAGNLIDQPARRRAAWSAAARLRPPAMIGRVPWAFRMAVRSTSRLLGADTTGDPAIVRGVPASGGRATGRVRIIRHPDRGHELLAGEILVAPITAPAWTPLFGRAAAVVTDVGSALAHASIIAREYGIPAVVGCGDATSRLRDGQLVTVDGGRGTVVAVDQ